MKTLPRVEAARRRQRQAAIGREIAAEEAEAARERDSAIRQQHADREARDVTVRRQMYDLSRQLADARRDAEGAAIDFEAVCSRLATGDATIEQAQAAQLVRDEARRRLECFSVAWGDLREDGAMRGRRARR